MEKLGARLERIIIASACVVLFAFCYIFMGGYQCLELLLAFVVWAAGAATICGILCIIICRGAIVKKVIYLLKFLGIMLLLYIPSFYLSFLAFGLSAIG